MAEVRIISKVDAEESGESGVPKPVVAVTYSTASIPPRTVTVPREQADDGAIAEAIRRDLAGIENGPPSTLDI
jgi:hypothetical protein